MELDYKILIGFSVGDLQSKVNYELRLGYKPLGAPFIEPANDYSGVKFCQAIIYEK